MEDEGKEREGGSPWGGGRGGGRESSIHRGHVLEININTHETVDLTHTHTHVCRGAGPTIRGILVWFQSEPFESEGWGKVSFSVTPSLMVNKVLVEVKGS